jgi:hypothetical protein
VTTTRKRASPLRIQARRVADPFQRNSLNHRPDAHNARVSSNTPNGPRVWSYVPKRCDTLGV